MAIYMLVHGGGAGGWVWGRVAPILRAAGHDVYTPTLTGVGERAHLLRPDTDLETHIADILGILKFEDLTDVILVGHSYGGMVITGVADRAMERISQLVFLDAANPRNGESLYDLSTNFMEHARKELRTVNGVEVVLGANAEVLRNVHGQADDIKAWKKGRVSPHPWRSFVQPLRLANEAAVWNLPRTNVNCTPIFKMRLDKERAMMGDRVWEIDTTHDLMVTEPQKTADMFLKLANI